MWDHVNSLHFNAAYIPRASPSHNSEQDRPERSSTEDEEEISEAVMSTTREEIRFDVESISVAVEKCSINSNASDTKDALMETIAAIPDKDKLIEFLQNKLLEKSRREEEMSLEIDRLKSLLK